MKVIQEGEGSSLKAATIGGNIVLSLGSTILVTVGIIIPIHTSKKHREIESVSI